MVTSREKKAAARELLEDLMSKNVPEHAKFACLDDLDLTEEQREDLTYDDVFWIQLVQKSLNGDMKATQEILDRRFGKAPQHILQDIRTFTYTDFLSSIQEEEAQELPSIPTTIGIRPQVPDSGLPEDGGSSGDDLLGDLGLLHE